MNHHQELAKLIQVIRDAGDIFKEGFEEASHERTTKSHHQDIVTLYDHKIDIFLQEKLTDLFPELSYIGEEIYEYLSPEQKNNIDFSNAIIVDPIDGTSNFSKQIPICAISVAIIVSGIERYGVIYNPISDQLYYAEAGKGAFYNESKIDPEDYSSKIDVRMAYGAKPGSPSSDAYDKTIYSLIPSDIRMLSLGSCVCECAYVSTQKLSGYLNNGTAIWDVAAAKIILNEVGIKMYELNGFIESKTEIELNKFEFYSFICYNPQIEKRLFSELKR
jgi:myo-inositol-1(or 4)-monophosphatase